MRTVRHWTRPRSARASSSGVASAAAPGIPVLVADFGGRRPDQRQAALHRRRGRALRRRPLVVPRPRPVVRRARPPRRPSRLLDPATPAPDRRAGRGDGSQAGRPVAPSEARHRSPAVSGPSVGGGRSQRHVGMVAERAPGPGQRAGRCAGPPQSLGYGAEDRGQVEQPNQRPG